jgi:moderate conductance mechanosensitive channel
MEWLTNLWYSVYKYMINSEMWINLGIKSLRILAIIIGTMIVIRISKSLVNNIFQVRLRAPLRLNERRENTLVKLIHNVLTYVIYFISFLMILMEFEIDVKGLIAGAGVVGLAVGFGAQNLVRDVITGFFIIFERQFSVGDYVKISKFEGFVEEIGLRVTKIKSWTGELHILPNSSITEVTNFSIHNSIAVVDISIAYEEEIPQAEKVIQELLEELPKKYEAMVKTPEYLGVQNLGASEVVLRVISEVKPMEHWATGRAMRKEIKLRFDENGIEIPFPRLVMYRRDEKQQVEEL